MLTHFHSSKMTVFGLNWDNFTDSTIRLTSLEYAHKTIIIRLMTYVLNISRFSRVDKHHSSGGVF